MLLPVALNVADNRCLIVGGGQVARRKAAVLLECAAKVVVIAPEVGPDWDELKVEHRAGVYKAGDVAGFNLVFACTNRREVNAQIAADAQRFSIWCNVVDDASASDFHLAASIRRGDILIGISTNGQSPALARHLKSAIENVVGPEYAELLELLAMRRATLKQSVEMQSERAEVWREVLSSDVLQLLREHRRDEAERLIDELTRAESSELAVRDSA